MGNRHHADEKVREALAEAERTGKCCIAKSDALRKSLQVRVQQGTVTQPIRGMYVASDRWASLERREQYLWTARTLQAKHPEWVFCGFTAAVAHGMANTELAMGKLVVASTTSNNQHLPNVIHHKTDISKVRTVRGIRVTPVGRTLFDCLRWMQFPIALAVADGTLRSQLLTYSQAVQCILDQEGSLGREQALEVLKFADPKCENGGESIVRALIIQSGFAAPQSQVEFVDDMDSRHIMRVDFCWKIQRPDRVRTVALELDGLCKYTDPRFMNGFDSERVRSDERLRESRLVKQVDGLIRISFKQALDQDYLIQLLDSVRVPHVAGIIPYGRTICTKW